MNHRLWFKGHFEVDHCRFSTNFWNCIVFQSKCDFELEISVMVFIEIRWKRKFGFREKDLFDQNVSEEQKTNRRWTSEVQNTNIRKEQWLSLFEFTVTHNLYTGQERSSCGLYWNYKISKLNSVSGSLAAFSQVKPWTENWLLSLLFKMIFWPC